MTDLDAIRARHVPVTDDTDYIICPNCLQLWGENGCDTAIVLAALDATFSDFEDAVGRALQASREEQAAIERETRLRAALEDMPCTQYQPPGTCLDVDGATPSWHPCPRCAALATTPASAPVEPTAEGE